MLKSVFKNRYLGAWIPLADLHKVVRAAFVEHALNLNLPNPRGSSLLLDFIVSRGLARLDAQCLPKPLYHSPSSAGQARENTMKGLWIEMKTREITQQLLSLAKQTQL